MSAVFETLGELSTYVEQNNVRVVDPGVPLTDIVHASDDLWMQPSVRKVVGFIARNVASIPLHVYERRSDDDRPRVVNGDLADIIRRPAAATTPYRFWELVLIDWLLHDRWCVQKVPDGNGGMELLRLPVRLWRFKSDGLDRIRTVQLHRDGRWVDHDPDGFIFDRGYSARGANGTSPADTLRELLEESAEAVAWRRSVWRNGARVPAVISRPGDAPKWSPEARNRFKRSWENFRKGGGREGDTPILEDGMILTQVDAFSARDAEDLEGRKLTDIEVCTAFHLAPEMLGIRQGTYSNVEAFRQSLYRDSLGPYITAWEQTINAMLTPDLSDGRALYVEAHIEAKLRGSFEEQAKVLSTATGAPYMLRDEARARLNLPQVTGGDELVVPLNVTVGGLASPRDTAPKARPVVRTKSMEDGLADVATEVDALEADLARYQQRLADTVASALGVKAIPSLSDAFDLDEWNDELATLLTGRSRRVAQAAATEVLDVWNPEYAGWDPDVMDPWLTTAAGTNAGKVNQGVYDRLADALTSGEGWRDSVGAVLGAAGFAAGWAVTLGTESASFGRNDAAGTSGLNTKTWRTTSANPRPDHQALDGVTIPFGDTFANGADWPGDWNAGSAQVVNCQCVVEYTRGET